MKQILKLRAQWMTYMLSTTPIEMKLNKYSHDKYFGPWATFQEDNASMYSILGHVPLDLT
jgi:hypothetical protein